MPQYLDTNCMPKMCVAIPSTENSTSELYTVEGCGYQVRCVFSWRCLHFQEGVVILCPLYPMCSFFGYNSAAAILSSHGHGTSVCKCVYGGCVCKGKKASYWVQLNLAKCNNPESRLGY